MKFLNAYKYENFEQQNEIIDAVKVINTKE